jgi:hypothetical protein
MANGRLTELAREFRALKDRKEELTAVLKAVDEQLTKLTTEALPSAMDDNDIEKFTVEGVGTIYTQGKVYAYVVKADEARFHQYLHDNEQGDLVKNYVFPSTLSAWAKEQLANGVELPEFVKASIVPTAMLRRI